MADVWHHKRLGEDISRGTISGEAEVLGLKGPWREAEAWCHAAGLDSLEKV